MSSTTADGTAAGTMSDAAHDWGIGRLDRRVAERICELGRSSDRTVLLAAMLAAAAPRGGHVCVDLRRVAGDVAVPRLPGTEPADEGDDDLLGAPLVEGHEAWSAPGDPEAWAARLVATPVARTAADAGRTTPLVVDATRVYLDRYWSYEDRLRDDLVVRAALSAAAPDEAVREVLDVVAPWTLAAPAQQPAADRQRLAVANGLLRPFSVISGGPGTGKTHTVVSLLAAHVLRAGSRDERLPRIAVAAPTGKAAARLEEAIREAGAERDLPPQVQASLEDLEASTLHRLLGYQRCAPTRFRHDRHDPLPHDLVVVDEASMVPLSMMTKLVEAVAPTATLVLVGDRNQLASVEAGAVLGDVCGPTPERSSLRLSDGWAATLAAATNEDVEADRQPMPEEGIWDGIVQLERFHRFGPRSGIGALARAMQSGDDVEDRVGRLLRGDEVEAGADIRAYHDIARVDPAPGGLPASLRSDVLAALAPCVEAALDGEGGAALRALDDLRVLCAVRQGVLGVRAVGRQVEEWLATAVDGFRPDGPDGWYVGRPVLVTRNDYDLALMNGDVGITVEHQGRLSVAFPDTGESVRHVPVARIGDCETTWAMTIHKSQGSQFGHAIVVLPDGDNRVLSRELVYTGVTRARHHVTIVGTDELLRAALRRPVRRATGLSERLWPTQR